MRAVKGSLGHPALRESRFQREGALTYRGRLRFRLRLSKDQSNPASSRPSTSTLALTFRWDARNPRHPAPPAGERERANGRRLLPLCSSMRAMEGFPVTCLGGEKEKAVFDGFPQFELFPPAERIGFRKACLLLDCHDAALTCATRDATF